MTAINRVSLCGILVSSPKPFGKRGRVEFEVAGFAKDTNAKDTFFHLVVRIKAAKMTNFEKGDAIFIEGRLGDHRKGGVILAKTVKPYTGNPETKSKNGIEGLCNAYNKATLKGHIGELDGDLSQGFCRSTIAVDEKTETVWHKIFFVRNPKNANAFDSLQTGDLIEAEGPILGTPTHHNLRADHLQLLQSRHSPPPTSSPVHKANEHQVPHRKGTGCIAGLFLLLFPTKWRLPQPLLSLKK